jgi:hypothetical protein
VSCCSRSDIFEDVAGTFSTYFQNRLLSVKYSLASIIKGAGVQGAVTEIWTFLDRCALVAQANVRRQNPLKNATRILEFQKVSECGPDRASPAAQIMPCSKHFERCSS